MRLINLDIDDLYLQSLTDGVQTKHSEDFLHMELGSQVLEGVSSSLLFTSPCGWSVVESSDFYDNMYQLSYRDGVPIVNKGVKEDDTSSLVFLTLRGKSLPDLLSTPLVSLPSGEACISLVAAGYIDRWCNSLELNVVLQVPSASVYILNGLTYSCFSDYLVNSKNKIFVSFGDLTYNRIIA